MAHEKSKRLFSAALQVIPGGVNSPARACKAVGIDPLFIHRGEGSTVFDADGNRYTDYVCSWGPLILGHRHPAVVEAIEATLKRGTTFGAPTDLEVTLAEMVVDAVPSVEMVRMVNSGTEATMSAIRLARAVTGRDMVIKFDGCYHGHVDTLLVAAGSGVATLGIPGSPGIPRAVVGNTISLPYNDLNPVADVMGRKGGEVACIIVEPVAGNMGVVPPEPGFLQGLRDLATRDGSLLVFDEVITGFRVAYGGAQTVYGVLPDLTCLGKILGGGLPVGAYGGRRSVMEKMAPEGPVYQAGTLSGNPLAVAAGMATLKALAGKGFYDALEEKAQYLSGGLEKVFGYAGHPITVNRVGSMMTVFFTAQSVRDFETAKTSNLDAFAQFFRQMLERGVYLPSSQFEALFVSAAHSQEDLDATIQAAREAVEILQT